MPPTFAAVAAAATAASVAAYLYFKRRPSSWSSTHRMPNGTTVTVRTARSADIAQVFKLVHDLAVVCGEGHEMQMGAADVQRAFERGEFEALVAISTNDSCVVGMAIVQESFRTFTGPSLYLQDLIVAAEHRGIGLGSLLFRVCAAFALRRGCNRLFWESVVDNHKANAFYAESMQAERVDNHLNWRVEGVPALERCAAKAC